MSVLGVGKQICTREKSTFGASSADAVDLIVRTGFVFNLATVFGEQLACATIALGIEVCDARMLGPKQSTERAVSLQTPDARSICHC
jgi:hypothetical protein